MRNTVSALRVTIPRAKNSNHKKRGGPQVVKAALRAQLRFGGPVTANPRSLPRVTNQLSMKEDFSLSIELSRRYSIMAFTRGVGHGLYFLNQPSSQLAQLQRSLTPWKIGNTESFNVRLRDELLDGEIFYLLHEAQIVIESWRGTSTRSGPAHLLTINHQHQNGPCHHFTTWTADRLRRSR